MKMTKKCLGAAIGAALFVAGCAEKGFDPQGEIGLVSREDGSGTRSAFVELTGVQEKDATGKKIDRTSSETMVASSTTVVLTTVAGELNALGYVSLGAVNDRVKVIAIDDAMPTTDNIASGRYALVHPFLVASNGDPEKLSAAAKDFLKWILSRDGQKVVVDAGYLQVGTPEPYQSSGAVSGKIVCAGSSSVTPCMERLKEAYQALHPQVTIEVQQSDSSTGLRSALEGICDLGMASRDLKDSEKAGGLVATTIALDGLAVIVNPQNPVMRLTREQIRKAFTGEVTHWSDL